MEFRIDGVVREKESKQPVRGLLVHPVDKDRLYTELLGYVITNSDGSFSIGYACEDFEELFENQPDIHLEIYGSTIARYPERINGNPIYTTERRVRFSDGGREYFEIEIPSDQLGADVPDIQHISTLGADNWKRLIHEYVEQHPVKFHYEQCKGFASPRLVVTAKFPFFGTSDVFSVRNFRKLIVNVTNNGNGISFSTYVEVFEGPLGFGHRLIDYRLCSYQILTVNPGQTVTISMRYNRLMRSGSLVVVCFDPFLDPLGFHIVEQKHHDHLTSWHYFSAALAGPHTTFYNHNSPLLVNP
ncbi:MAG TPA: hypothetical protein G4O11_07755 [Anaerolineae bacterium]|nr:hypothetical protein [Anaerolineae bacterium]